MSEYNFAFVIENRLKKKLMSQPICKHRNNPLNCSVCHQLPESKEECGCGNRHGGQCGFPAPQNNEVGWKKRLMDEFCVMFERADRNRGESGEEWVEKMESFIQNLLAQEKADLLEKIRGLQYAYDPKTGVRNKKDAIGTPTNQSYMDGYNFALSDIEELINK